MVRTAGHALESALGLRALHSRSNRTDSHHRPPWRSPILACALLLAGSALLAQAVVLIYHSVRQYDQFNLSFDFAIFHQAWYQIAHGNLDPRVTVTHYGPGGDAFWRSHFELIMWPMALLYWLASNQGLTLLLLQDLAIVAAEVLAIWWLTLVASHRSVRDWVTGPAILGTALLAAVNPWLYASAQQDFHFEALGACFALASAMALWEGRHLRCWIFVALTLSCGDVAAIFVLGVGLSFALAESRVRKEALSIVGVSLAWLLLIAGLGANQGSPIYAYAYLAGRPTLPSGVGGFVSVVKGVVLHPSRPASRLNDSWHQIARLLAPSGFVGILNPLLWGPVILTLAINVLNGVDYFREPTFQNFSVYLFTTAGTGLLVLLISGQRRWRSYLALAVLLASVGSGLAFDVNAAATPAFNVYSGPSDAGNTLERLGARIPDSAEVVSSFGSVGRFAGRTSVHTFVAPGNVIPVDEKAVIFVIAPFTGNQPTPPSVLADLVRLLVHLGARQLSWRPDLQVYDWRPPANVHAITVPT